MSTYLPPLHATFASGEATLLSMDVLVGVHGIGSGGDSLRVWLAFV